MKSWSFRDSLIKAIKKNEFLFFIVKYWRMRMLMSFTKNIDDRTYIEKQYKRRTGKSLNLVFPVLYNEKVQYTKLYYHDTRIKKLVDKYAVREYVKEKIGEKYLTKLYGVFETADEIPFELLPERFVVKLTNGSSYNYICTHKTKQEIRKIKRRFKKWIKLDLYMLGREWAYKDVPNRIICEEYLESDSHYGLIDYKVFCFNGRPEVVQVHFNRFSNHKMNLYNTNWEFIDEKFEEYDNDPGAVINKPENLNEMLQCAAKLSEHFPHVRVDFYSIGQRLIFGEMTFYHGAGYLRFSSEAYEKRLGDCWEVLNDNTSVTCCNFEPYSWQYLFGDEHTIRRFDYKPV